MTHRRRRGMVRVTLSAGDGCSETEIRCMGFRLNIVISSGLNSEQKREIMQTANATWPFICAPRNAGVYDDRVLFAPPELTDYLFDCDADYELAEEQSWQLEKDLAEFSKRFPGLTFAHVSTECFGGTCLYSGYCCRDGNVFFKVDDSQYDGHLSLLRQVNIETTSHFAPFVRGFFAGHGSGGYT